MEEEHCKIHTCACIAVEFDALPISSSILIRELIHIIFNTTVKYENIVYYCLTNKMLQSITVLFEYIRFCCCC